MKNNYYFEIQNVVIELDNNEDAENMSKIIQQAFSNIATLSYNLTVNWQTEEEYYKSLRNS